MKRITLRKSDIRELNNKISEAYGADDFLNRKDKIELIDDHIISHNNEPIFFYHESRLAPALKLLLKHGFPIKKVTVDMGAVKFVTSGADIMRPGIINFDPEIKDGDFIAIIDENNKKPLAIGKMMFSRQEAESMASGKIIKNIHHVGDELWRQ